MSVGAEKLPIASAKRVSTLPNMVANAHRTNVAKEGRWVSQGRGYRLKSRRPLEF